MWYIYILLDPRDNSVRYVGRTTSPRTREIYHGAYVKVGPHWDDSVPTDRVWRWVYRELRPLKLRPVFRIIDQTTAPVASCLEIAYIKYFTDSGCKLFNKLCGGKNQGRFSLLASQRD
jgi:hypothetical protein